MNIYKRIMLKLSGEALAGDKKTGFDEDTVRGVALQVKQLVDKGTEVGIVIGSTGVDTECIITSTITDIPHPLSGLTVLIFPRFGSR